ncbi:haloacid dehalogenase type II [Streptomyces sp. WMMC500]|uniref:haloacid dehalogenase type II n=1 Tax=Streptomyces sp. WMMC500 TaxID=3015154 RepID=UPI00248C5293|nr:haloacid dehalogenase type II [Streptomyces sp. WMMC500]WBB59525.1 haloacid dehalogenase type II [Streptomyces sp. WMMC500]
MPEIRDAEIVVFDVLGTLVDEPGGLRAEIRAAAPAADDAAADDLLALWQGHVEAEQARMARGQRPYADSETVDREAAELVAERAGVTDPAAVARLATATRRLPPWPDSAAGLDRVARHFPVAGLSNAAGPALLRLAAHGGLRWHQALSGAAVRAYKPAPEVYRLAAEAADCPPERVLMVAAHAWDLRAARENGLRTAYVPRPVGDPPAETDAFDWHFDGLDGLVEALTAQ